MNERTNTPFKSLFFALSLIPLIIPAILFTVAWILLAQPARSASSTWCCRAGSASSSRSFDIYSLAGMIWVDGLHYSPMAFLLMTRGVPRDGPVARGVGDDERRERACRWRGASRCKLAWPAIFATILILFVRAIESFEVPALLGLPVGIEVFTSSIYQAVHRYPSQIGLASAYAWRCSSSRPSASIPSRGSRASGSKYATMTGKGFRPRQIDLGALALAHGGASSSSTSC